MTIPMIKTDRLCHTYEDEDGKVVYALKDISLTVDKGESKKTVVFDIGDKQTLAG